MKIFTFAYLSPYSKSSGTGGIIAKRKKGRKAIDTGRSVNVYFKGHVNSQLNWSFEPCQNWIKCRVGESALAFYRVTNHSDVPVKGIASYDILPVQAGQYFNKIQCFCFDEQLLKPGETVDMPVLFMVDPDYNEDPFLYSVDKLTLAYTFYRCRDGFKLPIPNFLKNL